MKRTLTEQYGLIKKGKGHKDVFLKEAKKLFPNLLRQGATYNEASKILKQKNIINENFVGLGPINNPFEVKKKEGYESAFENFLKEAAEVKAEEKKVSKEVEEDQSRGYNNKDEKNPNNMIFGQIQMGYYNELKNPKNADKTEQEIKDIVFKNLEKDPIYYTTHGQFGEEDLGYTDEAPSLGEPKEPKGPYKSSGYGTLKENKLVNEHSVSMLGGVVTGTGFVGMNYMDYYGLNEEDTDNIDTLKTGLDDIKKSKEEIGGIEMFKEDDVTEEMVADIAEDALYDLAEELYDDLGSVDEVLEYIKNTLPSIERNLGLKYGDY